MARDLIKRGFNIFHKFSASAQAGQHLTTSLEMEDINIECNSFFSSAVVIGNYKNDQ